MSLHRSFRRRGRRTSITRNKGGQAAFTLIELLVSMTVGTIMIVFLFQVFNAATKAWRQGEDQAETYREARAAMQMMVRDLSQTVQPMTASVYASPTPTPSAVAKNIAPVLVIDRYNGTAPAGGGEINEEVYCLTTIPNNGVSNLCAVGYFCQWKPLFDSNPARAPRAFSLMRQYLGSGAPANAITGAAAIPGLYDRFKLYGANLPLTFQNIYDRPAAGATPSANPPQSTVTELASYIWDLQIRTPDGLVTPPASPAYPWQPTYMSNKSYATALPAYVEIRFKALSESAARQLEGNNAVQPETWNDARAGDNAIYKNIILPGTRQFSARVPIYSGSATSTPSP